MYGCVARVRVGPREVWRPWELESGEWRERGYSRGSETVFEDLALVSHDGGFRRGPLGILVSLECIGVHFLLMR